MNWMQVNEEVYYSLEEIPIEQKTIEKLLNIAIKRT